MLFLGALELLDLWLREKMIKITVKSNWFSLKEKDKFKKSFIRKNV